MTLSTKIEVLRILHLFAVGLHTCTAVARSLCVSWAFLLRLRRLVELTVFNVKGALVSHAEITSCSTQNTAIHSQRTVTVYTIKLFSTRDNVSLPGAAK